MITAKGGRVGDEEVGWYARVRDGAMDLSFKRRERHCRKQRLSAERSVTTQLSQKVLGMVFGGAKVARAQQDCTPRSRWVQNADEPEVVNLGDTILYISTGPAIQLALGVCRQLRFHSFQAGDSPKAYPGG